MTSPDRPRGPVPDADPLDELAGAIVDGEATPEEQARRDEPAVAARIAAFEAIAAAVGAPVESPGDRARDAAVAAALSAPAEITELASRRARRTPTWLPALGAVAATALALVGLGALISGIDSDDDSDTATAGVEADDSGAGGGAATTAADADPFSLPAILGDFDTAESLAAAAADLESSSRAAASPAAGDAGLDDAPASESAVGPVPCVDQLGPFDLGATTARLDGVEVVVGLLEEPDGSTSYLVLDAGTCQEVARGSIR